MSETTLASRIEAAFWANIGEQADYGPNVDMDWLLSAILEPTREPEPESDGREGGAA